MNPPANIITRRNFLRLAALAPLSALHAADTKPAKRPNIVYLFTDQQPWYQWSLGGAPEIKTPNLERLARDGVYFDNALSNNPICCPFRACFVSGQFSQRNGILWNYTTSPFTGQRGLRPDGPSWAKVLREAGYKTGYVGKWHLYPEYSGAKVDPITNQPTDFLQVPPEYRYGFDWWRNSYDYTNYYATKFFDDRSTLRTLEGYAPAAQIKQAMEFIEANRKDPFAIVVSFLPPHPPYGGAPKKWGDYYSKQKLPNRPNVPEDLQRQYQSRELPLLAAQISAMDEALGGLLDKLDTLGLTDDTIVVWSSDHGNMLGSHSATNKRCVWDESIKIPFIVRWPNGISGGARKLDTLLSAWDIGPTLLGLCGLKPDPRMDGLDLSHVLRNQPGPEPESAFILHVLGPEGQEPTAKGISHLIDFRGVRTKHYTYALQKLDGHVQPYVLYDNQTDPYQMKNLIDDPSHAETQKQLRAEVEKWLARAGESKWLKEGDHWQGVPIVKGKTRSPETDR